MADRKRYASNQPLDLGQILEEAQHRWLRPTEICEILRNYGQFRLTSTPPVKPSAGSLFLYDRKVLRYFRKDGHCWRKKKDGKTVNEAHEKLKSGSVEVLHCYYAHREDNENFQRRCYWMLDEQMENIVLVHYREVKEGEKLGNRLKNADTSPQVESTRANSSPSLDQIHSPETTTQMYPNSVDWIGKKLSTQFEDRDLGGGPESSSLVQLLQHPPYDHSFMADEINGLPEANFNGVTGSWSVDHRLSRTINPLPEQDLDFDQVDTDDLSSHKLIDARLADNIFLDAASFEDWLAPDFQTGPLENNYCSAVKVGSEENVVGAQLGGVTEGEAVEQKELDSFERWWDKEIAGDFDDNLITHVTGKYWDTLDTRNEEKEGMSLCLDMLLDTDFLGPSLSQQQLFSINDFAPQWTISGMETKILVIGSFWGDKRHFDSYKWYCMFGEIEVPAEFLCENVIRCQAPSHAPGRVPFYITCSDRLACSEVREFEFREKPSVVSYPKAFKTAPEDEERYLIRLVKLLSSGLRKKKLNCTVKGCDRCKVKNAMYGLKKDNSSNCGRVDEALMIFEGSPRDALIQDLLKDKFFLWLACQMHEEDKGINILDEEGQGVIHLAAALGFEWAIGPIVAAGVSPNFRDARGRTALHWASYHGREETVAVLVKLGAAAGAVDDPSPSFHGGQKASDLASSRGHKGLAGYLAEADLTSHLSSLSADGSVVDSAALEMLTSTKIAAEYADPSPKVSDVNLSMKRSLTALRRSVSAAALIQNAFRIKSFRHRQMTKSNGDMSDASVDLVGLGSLHKLPQTNNYLHAAAARIQKNYLSWKRRKEFMKMRKHIVKIQAHVRGRRLHKQYKKVVWSVSIVEKAVLRWRRRKPGLRGLRMKSSIESLGPEAAKNDEYDFLRIGRKQKFADVDKALARVQSMVRYPDACDQYMRLVTKFEELQVSEEGSITLQQVDNCEGVSK